MKSKILLAGQLENDKSYILRVRYGLIELWECDNTETEKVPELPICEPNGMINSFRIFERDLTRSLEQL